MLNRYLINTYRSLTNTSMIPLFIWYFNWYDNYRFVILKIGFASIGNNGVKIHNPYWILLKFWAQTRKLQDQQNSQIDSPNGSWYLNKTYVDGKWHIFRNICFVIFSWLSVVCRFDECPIVLLYILYYKRIILVNKIF